jgi:two-component system chemotaxis response regulator CheY
LLAPYGDCQAVQNGKEAVEAFRVAKAAGSGYDLICLDIEMPEMNGQATLKHIRALEQTYGVLRDKHVKVIMTTALDDVDNVMAAYKGSCDAYLVKPFNPDRLVDQLRKLSLIG